MSSRESRPHLSGPTEVDALSGLLLARFLSKRDSSIMNIPFTTGQFLDVFRAYNEAVWPIQVLLYILGLALLYLAIRRGSGSGRIISAALAFFWTWMGTAYHILVFTSINPVAYIFGGLFILQGVAFLYAGVFKKLLSFQFRSDLSGIAGCLLLLYAMVLYPALGYVLGHRYPHSPTFGLPCPTTIFTFGLLLWTDGRIPWFVLVIPLLWSIIGFTAAISLGIKEDVGLLVAAVTVVALLAFRHRTSGPVPP